MNRLAAIVLLPAVVLTSCRPDPSTNAADTRRALESILEEHSRLIIAGDVAGILGQYTADAVVRSNHAEPLRGHAAIQAFVESMVANVSIHTLTYQTEDLAVYGDSAWHVASYGLTGAMGTQAMADSGSVYILWTRGADGTWRVKHDILNSRLPLPPPPAPRAERAGPAHDLDEHAIESGCL
jgi:uncharacterized protein (TIGR02246 family)